MLSIGIIWNCAYEYSNQIIKDINDKTSVIGSISIDLGNKYIDFVKDIYASEQMEEWKIEKKINYMLLNENRNITIIFFEFDNSEIEYHPFKKKNVFSKLENCKTFIREKYKPYVENYTFDIIFHATDNITELKNCFNVIISYIDLKTTEKVLKLISNKI